MLQVDEEIQELILKGGSEEDMYKAARKNGFMTIKEDAIVKALEHVIPYEEMNVFGSKISDGGEDLTADKLEPVAENPVVPAEQPSTEKAEEVATLEEEDMVL